MICGKHLSPISFGIMSSKVNMQGNSKPRLVLTEQQDRILKIFVEKLSYNSPPSIFALSGSAGVGKTFLLSRIPDYVDNVVFTAPTHAAVRVLRNKLKLAGYPDTVVKTYYAACLTPIYTKEFQLLIQNYNAANVGGVTSFFSNVDKVQVQNVMAEVLTFDEFLHEMQINRDDYLERWKATRENVGRAIVIDEASMLHVNDLTEIQKAFTHIGLVGDPRQLYPVSRKDGKDMNVSALQTYTSDELTLKKILRTNNLDIIQAAKYAWKHGTYSPDIPVEEYTNEHARKYVPIICFMNRTRLSLNATIRESLGFKDLSVGDCLVLRGKMKPFEVSRGLYNNSMWVVDKIDKDMAHLVSRNGLERWQCPLDSISIEDLNSKPNRYNFRFAWALTCHTAQGSEWPTVFICPDRFIGPESDRWYYTAVTRAQKNLFILK